MIFKILLSAVLLIAVFLAYVSTRDGNFRYVRSGLINASPAEIFPYISDLKLGGQWSPYQKKDPNLKTNFIGPSNAVGGVMEFAGNSEAGTGSLEILKIVPNDRVEIRLLMTKPINASNLIEYTLTPEGNATRFIWTMSGNGGFMGKLIGVFIDCEKMVAGDFEKGIQNLKELVEEKNRKDVLK